MSLDSDDSHEEVKSIDKLHHECACLKKKSQEVFMNQQIKSKLNENIKIIKQQQQTDKIH